LVCEVGLGSNKGKIVCFYELGFIMRTYRPSLLLEDKISRNIVGVVEAAPGLNITKLNISKCISLTLRK